MVFSFHLKVIFFFSDSDVCFYQFKVLCKDSKEFSMIEQYVKNTHAETHTQYELEVLEVTVWISLVFLTVESYSYFIQASIIYFCRGNSCCQYDQGVLSTKLSARGNLCYREYFCTFEEHLCNPTYDRVKSKNRDTPIRMYLSK